MSEKVNQRGQTPPPDLFSASTANTPHELCKDEIEQLSKRGLLPPFKRQLRSRRRRYPSFFLTVLLSLYAGSACRQEAERGRVPSEVNEVVANVGENIAHERYEQIYNESSDLWKKEVTLEQSNEVFKTLRTKLGKVESRTLHSATEQHNSGGVLKGHVYILSYQTRFEQGDGMETFTLIEDNGRWLLARYFVNSTALK